MKNLHHFGTLTILAALVLAACGPPPAQSWSGVAASADGATVYITGNTHLYALNINGGAKRWQFPADNDGKIGPFYADPVIGGDMLIVTSFHKSVSALDADRGAARGG